MTNPNVGTIDPRRFAITLGSIIVTGVARGSFIEIEPSGDAFEVVTGADGTTERYAKHMNQANIKLTLLATSPTNKLLSQLHKQDKESNTGKVPFLAKDLNSDETGASFAQAWIQKAPTLSAADTAVTREWLIQTGPGEINYGASVL